MSICVRATSKRTGNDQTGLFLSLPMWGSPGTQGENSNSTETFPPTLQTLQFRNFPKQFSSCCFPSKCTLQEPLSFCPNQWVKSWSVTSVRTLRQKPQKIFSTMLKALERALREALCTTTTLRDQHLCYCNELIFDLWPKNNLCWATEGLHLSTRKKPIVSNR